MSGKLNISPHETVATADHENKIMKSGYGIAATADSTLTLKVNDTVIKDTSAIAAANATTLYFPEFQYENYWRIMDTKDRTAAHIS